MNTPFQVVAPAEIAEHSGEFTGRESVIRELMGWLEGAKAAYLLTGPAGSGKSQLALRLAEICSSPQSAGIVLLHAHFCRARDDRTLDPQRFAAELARCLEAQFPDWRQVLDDRNESVVQRVTVTVGTAESGATVAGVLSPITLGEVSARPALQRLVVRPLERLHELNALPDRLLIIVDALDEALTYPASDTIVDALASLVGTLPQPVRLMLTSRPDPVVLHRLSALETHDLGTENADVLGYARQRLAGTREPGRTAWAEAIAGASEGNFLYARHVLEDLLARPRRLAANPQSTPLPAGLGAYYAEYLDRELSRTNQAWSVRYRPLLSLLAVARGTGLTRNMLADITQLPRSQLDDALNRLHQYLVGPRPDGPFRVYHESFREYLMTEQGHQIYPEEAERELARYLASAPQSEYARMYRAAHAAGAGRLDELLCDAGAILNAEPRSVLAVVDAAQSLEGRRAGEAFRRAYPRLNDGVAPLHLAALQVGAEQLVRSIASLPSTRPWSPWRPLWAWWRRPAPAQALTRLETAGYSYPPGYPPVAALDTNDGPVAVIATRGTVECWDLDHGERLAQVPAPARVRCIVDCGSQDHPTVALGDDAGSITLLSVPSLVNRVERADAHPAHITRAVHLPSSGLLATGDAEGTIALWALPALTQVARRLDAHTLIYALAAVRVGGEELLISGGDRWQVAPGRARNMPSLRAWTLPDLEARASESRDDWITQWLGTIQAGESVFVQVRGGTSEVWRLDPRARAFQFVEPIEHSDPSYLIQTDDSEGILCSEEELVPLRVQQAAGLDRLDRGRPVECEPASWAGPVTARGRDRLLVSAGRKLQLWAIRDVVEESAAVPDESVHARRAKTSVTQVTVGSGMLCASTQDGTVHTWATGSTPVHEEHPLSRNKITGLAVSTVAGRTCLVVGLESGELSLVDALTNEVLWKIMAGEGISAVKTMSLAGRPVALTAVKMSAGLNICRLWDLSTSEEIESFDEERERREPGSGWRLAVQGYQRDKELSAVTVWQTQSGTMAAATCSSSPVPIWLLEEQRQVVELHVDITGAQDLAFGHGHLVVGSGTWLHIWDASRHWAGFSVPAHHTVSRVTCGTFERGPCIASGGFDGSLRLWGLDGSDFAAIDVDETITALAALDDGRYAIGTSRGVVVIETGENRGGLLHG